MIFSVNKFYCNFKNILLIYKNMEIKKKIQQNIVLAPFTTFKIGGPAKFFIEAKTKNDLIESYKFAKNENEEIFLLGGGSNVVINSNKINGLVIKMDNDNIRILGDRLSCEAGASLTRIITIATREKLTGLEWAIGIPRATIGGAIVGNAGAFKKKISELVETIEIFNIKKQKFEIFSKKDCKFKYRESIFKNNDNYLVWSVGLKLKKNNTQSIIKLNEKILNLRNHNQPKLPNAGCIFKNFTIDELELMNSNIANLAKKENIVKNGKVGAGWIINMAGIKGKTIGGAKISLEHANFIVNTGNASSENVIMLISFIKQQIRDKFKIQLQEEIQYIGF